MPTIRDTTRALALATALACWATAAHAQSANAVAAALAKQTANWSGQNFDVVRLREGYAARGNRPIFTDGYGRLNAFGEELLSEIGASHRDGLDPSDYLGGLSDTAPQGGDAEAARLELALADAFLKLGHDLHSGITTPSVTDPNIVIARKKADWAQWLDGAATQGPRAMFAALRPSHPQYAMLRQMLGGYRSLLLRGGWEPIDKGETLKPGMTSARVDQMRRNLMARGYDGLQTAEPDRYDDNLKEAVAHFQKRHGLADDGVAGPNTFKALSVSAEDRVRQLAVNLERWRWLPRNLGRNHVLVNQAGFELFMVADGKVVDNRRVIVGKPFHQSPMFSDEIVYSEFNPTWTVPNSIASKEMLPKIKSDPSYLATKGYDLFSGGKKVNPYAIDWSSVGSRMPYTIVQPPGPKNALGQVKFIFPNKFAVYLHDTPSRSLFSRYGRAFSHGCIRVQEPLDFARKIYRYQGGMDPARVDPIVASKKRQRVNLKRKLPVHLAYFTAWVDDNGVPLFFDDVYKRDRLVSRYMF